MSPEWAGTMSYRNEKVYASGLSKRGVAHYRWAVVFQDQEVIAGRAFTYKGAKRAIAKRVASQRAAEASIETWTETL